MRLILSLVYFLMLGVAAFAASVRMGIIGDFGVDDANELAVARLVATNFQPEFIVTVGDNNYLGGANIDRAIGKYYHQFIGNYTGAYGAGASSNRFFPALGNHDWAEGSGFAAHTNYFTLPGNERYYDFIRGPIHFFIVNSDMHEPDGATATSVQARWLSNQLAASASPWRIVIAQDPPYSSASATARMRWPFKLWGASAVVSGHAHHYERIQVDGLSYIVNGAGGASLANFGTAIAGSLVRYNTGRGAMLVTATDTNINYAFWSVANGGTVIDQFTQTSDSRLSIARQANSLRISWPTNGTDGLVLRAATALGSNIWMPVPQPAMSSNSQRFITIPATGQQQFFRLKR